MVMYLGWIFAIRRRLCTNIANDREILKTCS